MNFLYLYLILCSMIGIKSEKSEKLLTIERVSNTSAVITCPNSALQTDKLNYELKIIKQSDPEQISTDYELSATKTTVKVENLDPGTTYSLELIALTSDRRFSLEQAHFTTKPSPPFIVKILLLNETEVSLEWATPQTEDNTVLVSLVDSQNSIIYNEIEKHSPSHLFSNLRPGNAYTLVILNSIIGDNKSIVVSDPIYSRFRTRPLPPTNIRDDAHIKSDSLRIKWSAPSTPSHFDGYRISYKLKARTLTWFQTINQIQLRILESIHPGMKYRIMINSFVLDHLTNQTILSKPIYHEIVVRPLPLIKLNAKTISETEILVEWRPNPQSTQDSYQIYYHRIGGDDHGQIQFMEVTNSTHFLISELNYGHNYSIGVFAVSHDIKSNITEINVKMEMSKTIPSSIFIATLIALLVICIVGLVIMAIFFYNRYHSEVLVKEDEQAPLGLTDLETIRPSFSNIYTMIDPVLQIDENIRINREHLELNREIGKGQFGTVYSGYVTMKCAQLSKKEPVAIKTSSCEQDMNSFLKEALIMKNFNHDNVLSLIGVSLDEKGSPLVVLPFMKNGDLLKYIRNEENQPTVKQLISFAIDVANGMEYLSSQQFIHRDLSARNCMLDNDLSVKIADFGLSRHLRANNSYISDNSNQLLPIRWMSIESIEKSIYNTKTDVWSYGVLVWEVLTRGVNPYAELNNRDILNHLKGGHRLPQPQYCPHQIYETLNKCWELNPNNRPTFPELSSTLQGIIDQAEKVLQQKQIDINEANVYYNLAPMNKQN